MDSKCFDNHTFEMEDCEIFAICGGNFACNNFRIFYEIVIDMMFRLILLALRGFARSCIWACHCH